MARKPQKSFLEQLQGYREFVYRLTPRWWIVAIGTLAGAGLAIALALLLPRVYQSRALLTYHEGVSQRRIFSREETTHTDWTWLKSRLEFLASSHTRLRKLIKDYDLYPRQRRSEPELKLLERMHKAILFDSLGGTSFWLAFEYPDRYRAQQVAAQLVRDFVEQNVGEAVATAVATKEFMESETRKAREQLDAADNAIALFVSEHPEFETDPGTGMLRGSAPPRAGSSVSRAMIIKADTPELRAALQQKGQLEAQLRLVDTPGPDPVLAQARHDVTEAQRLLAAKLRRYTDAHPDVQRVRAQLQQAQATLRTATAAQRKAGSSAAELRDKLAAVDQTIADLSRTRQAEPKVALKKQARPSRLSSTAQLEKRWYELTRERTIGKGRYDQLQERLTKARVGADMEKQRALLQFEIIDAPNLPQRPVRPSRTKLAIVGTLFGLLVGFGVAGLLVLIDPRVYSREDVYRACDVPVLAMVPREESAT